MQKIDHRIMGLSLAWILVVEAAMAGVQGGAASLVVLGCGRLFELVGLFFLVTLLGKGVGSLGLARDTVGKGLRRGVGWSGAFGGGAVISGLLLFFFFKIDPLALIRVNLPLATGDRLLFLVIGGLLAPVVEEVFFRGILYGYFRRWGVAPALVLSSLFFVGAHLASSTFFLPQLVGGLLFAVSYEVEKNLLVPVMLHMTGNLAIFAVSLIMVGLL